jgi:HSP20 family protein
MSSVQKRSEPSSALGRLDRLFDEWMGSLAMRRSFGTPWEMLGEELIRVDEYRDGDTQVIRGELPGIDPERDVELTVQDGMLRIHAQRRVEEETEDKGTPGTSSATAA